MPLSGDKLPSRRTVGQHDGLIASNPPSRYGHIAQTQAVQHFLLVDSGHNP